MTKTCISCELNPDPDPNPVSWLQRWSGHSQAVSTPAFHTCPMKSVHTRTVLTLVKEMTAAVNQPIPLDASRGRAWGFVHLRIAIIPYIICDYRVQVCMCECLWGEWKSLWLGHLKVKWVHPLLATQDFTRDVNLCPEWYKWRPPSKDAALGCGQQKGSKTTVSERKTQVELAINEVWKRSVNGKVTLNSTQ